MANSDVSSALYARLRSGTLNLRMETGSWAKEKEEKRLCKICVTGKVESEEHFLLECYVYNPIRDSMYKRISDQTGYNLLLLKDDKNWLMDVLLGHGLQRKEVREKVGTAVSKYVALAMKIRKQNLSHLS